MLTRHAIVCAQGFEPLARLRHLRILDVCGAQRLTDEHVEAIAAANAALEELKCTWCVQLTDAAVRALAAGCAGLRWLSLHGIRGISGGALDALERGPGGPQLVALDVNGCAGIPAERRSKESLRALLPLLEQTVIHT